MFNVSKGFKGFQKVSGGGRGGAVAQKGWFQRVEEG